MEIKQIVEEVINEVKNSKIDSDDGLCFFYANNISFDLSKYGFENMILNVRDYTFTNYDHYFIISKNNLEYYLIDPSYRQFMPKRSSTLRKEIGFKMWPVEFLQNSAPDVLSSLLNDGLAKVDNADIINYLNSFEQGSLNEIYFSLEDMFEPKIK